MAARSLLRLLAHGDVKVQYITKLIKPVLDGVVSSFEVTAEANAEYNNRLQKGVQRGVWNLAQSWYRVDGNGRNCVIFPCRFYLIQHVLLSAYSCIG